MHGPLSEHASYRQANITFVSRQLGHTSSQITLGIYAHLLDGEEQARRTREMLQVMLGGYVRGDVAN
jgi:integrase